MLASVLASFLADPFKALLGGSGVVGLLTLLIRWWRGRPTIRGRFVGETYDLKVEPAVLAEVRIEVENLGREPTSLVEEVQVTYFTARTHRVLGTLSLQDQERMLAPVSPRIFTLRGSLPASYLFSHFRVFHVRATRGSTLRLRVLNASGKSAGTVRFAWLRLLFIAFGALPHVGA